MHDPSLHLFVDDYHIRNAHCLKRVFFPLEQDHQAVLIDGPGRYFAWACVQRENERFRCWYHSVARVIGSDLAKAGVWGTGSDIGYYSGRHAESIPAHQLSCCGYAESPDGVAWTRPNLGLIDWQGNTNNNLCFDGSGPAAQFDGFVTNLDSVSVLRDDSDPDPAKRYKMINHWESIHCWEGPDKHPELKRPKELLDKFWSHRAKYLTTSPDGIHWEKTITRIKSVEGGDYCGVVRDERNGRWLFADRPAVGLGTGYFRLAGSSASKDLYHLPAHLEHVMYPGEFEEYGYRYEHHGWTPFNYGDQDLGVLELSIGGTPIMGVLCAHRDGQQWKVLNYDTPLLKIGPTGADDDTIVAVTRNAPFAVGEKLRFYYNGRHGGGDRKDRFGGLFPAHLRLDGFAGMTVDTVAAQRHNKPAVLQTQMLRITQPQMQLNIQRHNQSAQVAVLDDSMTPIPGYDVTDCLPIDEDATRAVVRWRDHADLAALKGQDVHVNIKLNAGTIYSIRL